MTFKNSLDVLFYKIVQSTQMQSYFRTALNNVFFFLNSRTAYRKKKENPNAIFSESISCEISFRILYRKQ